MKGTEEKENPREENIKGINNHGTLPWEITSTEREVKEKIIVR